MTTAGYQSDYAKYLVASELSKLGEADLTKAFPDAFTDPQTWGDGVSTKMLDALHAAGLEHLCITTGDLSSAADKPQVAARANELGYLFGPYDSYDAVHRPGEVNTWETAQFDQQLYDTGGVVLRDGKRRPASRRRAFCSTRPRPSRTSNGASTRWKRKFRSPPGSSIATPSGTCLMITPRSTPPRRTNSPAPAAIVSLGSITRTTSSSAPKAAPPSPRRLSISPTA